MRIALIGTGFIAQMHRDTLKMLGEEIALVVGHSREKAEAFAGGCGRPGEVRTADHLSMELLSDMDCAVICTPPSEHAAAIRTCIASHTHILCEKPLSLDPAEAEALAREADASGLICAVNFNNRFYEGMDLLKNAFPDGEKLFISARYFQEFQRMPAAFSWRFTDPMRAVTEIGSHLVDLLCFVTGKIPAEISASFYNTQPRRRLENGILDHCSGEASNITVENEDAAYSVLRFTDGSMAGITLCEIAPGRSNDLSIELIGRDKSISWSAQRPYETVTGEPGCRMTTQTNAFGRGFSGTMTESMRAFLATVRTGEWDTRLTSFSEAARCAAICAAMKESNDKGGCFVQLR